MHCIISLLSSSSSYLERTEKSLSANLFDIMWISVIYTILSWCCNLRCSINLYLLSTKLSVKEIDNLHSYIHHNQTLESVKQSLDYKIVVSDIIGKNIVSKRFADKVMSIFSKYQKEELKLIMNCSKMVYYDPYFCRRNLFKSKTIQFIYGSWISIVTTIVCYANKRR